MPITLAGITIYSLAEIAQTLKTTVVTLRRYIRDGKLRARKIGGNEWYVSEEALAEFLQGEREEK